MAIVLSQPEPVFPAYNPAILTLHGEDEESINLSVSVDGQVVSTHNREFFTFNPDVGPVAKFDLGGIAREFFSPDLIEIGEEYNEGSDFTKSYIDRRLGVKFTVTPDGVNPTTFLAVNAALGPGVPTTYFNKDASGEVKPSRLLIRAPKLLYYSGFTPKSMVSFVKAGMFSPDEISFEQLDYGSDIVYSILGTGAGSNGNVISTVIPSNDPPGVFDITDTGVITLTYQGVERDRVYIQVMCVPDCPFYVRWINSLGGWEHWMFSKRVVETQEIDDSVMFTPWVERNSEVGEASMQVSLTSTSKVDVGFEGVENAYFEALREIVTSPEIEYYDTKLDKWMHIAIDDFELPYNKHDPRQSGRISFLLPPTPVRF